MRYSADSQKEPSHQKIIEENNYLIEKINTLRREVEINRTKYKELECVKKRTKKKKSPSKIIRKSVVEEPTKQVQEHIYLCTYILYIYLWIKYLGVLGKIQFWVPLKRNIIFQD